MKIELELNMIQMPNFLTFKAKVPLREGGFKELPSVAVEDLTLEQATTYAEEMKLAFLEHYNNKKK